MGFDIQQQSPVRRIPIEWKAPSDWFPRITVTEPARLQRGMGYGAWLRAKPVALLAEMPLLEVREQRTISFRGSRNHKLY